mmetsp:Transcript_7941/g.49040  ORF Transcript_7941/g.49040 Transcript_7941/m.49040 type:complete len:146 (+) Transcript_7941:499-936(+)
MVNRHKLCRGTPRPFSHWSFKEWHRIRQFNIKALIRWAPNLHAYPCTTNLPASPDTVADAIRIGSPGQARKLLPCVEKVSMSIGMILVGVLFLMQLPDPHLQFPPFLGWHGGEPSIIPWLGDIFDDTGLGSQTHLGHYVDVISHR